MRLLVLLAALSATPAVAQQTPPIAPALPGPRAQPMPTVMAEPVAVMIAAFDADGDAQVTRPEFAAGLKRSFDSIDRTGAGSLGYIAFSDWSERWLGDRNTLPSPFETDRNGDNRITYEELAARFDLLFTRFDVDKDGAISRRELLTVRPQMFERGPRREALPEGKPRRRR
ncbi:EF-hand domain-containing protein [Sphingomonas sp. M1-B02]|uniref:EF-hand domain-containing protein n=1 Tax=Sphingomonas sp. M1-B02 TaxID=3114300 RepID=UPI00223FAC5F|nr:EF-hand domain-containing protein [Sphingomonas sp. S6-11]UZK67609.1 EF-hand domain-containing protein [Sphingomonas sp. S6-11]